MKHPNLTTKAKLRQMLQLASTGGKRRYRRAFLKSHPRDRAEHFFSQDRELQQKLIGYLSDDEVAELFESIDLENRLTHLEALEAGHVANILSKMHTDDAVDILNELGPHKTVRYLSMMDKTVAMRLNHHLRYEEATAGSLMTTEIIAVDESFTVEQALEALKQGAQNAITIYYVYVTDNQNRLSGAVSLKEMIIADNKTSIRELGHKHVIYVTFDEMKQEAARLMKDYNLLALPVVDREHKLLGAITIDDIVDFLDDEADDDYAKMATVTDVEPTDPPLLSAKKRLPWLILLLFLGMITASLISKFESTITQIAILGAFIPVIAGTTGNSGTQSLAIVVRGLATGKLSEISLKKYFFKEVITALITSIACGVILMLIIYAWKHHFFIGVIAGLALTISIFIGTLAGTVIPLTMKWLKMDPAVASGPLITTISDVFSMAIYFSIATATINVLL